MNNQTNRELTLTRVYDASRNLVWQAWTDPKLIAQWWGPNGVTNPVCEFDARPNGNIHIVMLAGEALGPMKGQEWPMTGIVREVERPNKLVFTSNAIMNGKPVLENLVTVTFEDEGEKTKMTVHIVVTKTTPEAEGPLKGMEMGWNQQMDKLGEFLVQTDTK